MIKHKRKISMIGQWLFFPVFLCLLAASSASALPEAGHISVQNQYAWGMTTEVGHAIHSSIIDKVPWRDNVGGYDHRKLWGHSEEWFYHGRIPKTEAMTNIRANLVKRNPFLSGHQLENEAQMVFKEAVSKTGQERIAEALREHIPLLTKKESMAMAEQLYAAHLVGDSTTAEGLRYMSEAHKQRVNAIVEAPLSEAMSGFNKSAMYEAMSQPGEKFSVVAFARQQQNFARLKVEQYAQKGFKIYNPASRSDIGITVNGQNYIVKTNWKDAVKAIERFPSAKVFIADDVYAKGASRYPELVGKVVPESSVTGVKVTLAEQQEEITRAVAVRRDEIQTANINKTTTIAKKMRQNENALKKIAPYALAGGVKAVSENWEILKDAWNGKATWAKALTRTGVDFAGYTVTPYIVDGILTQIGSKTVIAASLKGAGMGYTLGFFIWSAGKEYLAYQLGDISHDEFVKHMKQRGAQAGREAVMVPINILVCKLISPAAGTYIVPLVIVGGSFAIQRVQAWYEDKRWRETVSLEEVRDILGEDLLNEFTLMTPETRSNLVKPEGQPNLAEPENNFNLAAPERNSSLLEYGTR